MHDRRYDCRHKGDIVPLEEITGEGLSPRCMRCMIDKGLNACPADAPWEVQADYMRRVLRLVAEGSDHMTAPEIGHGIDLVLHDMFGIVRDYTDAKHHFNQLVLGIEERVSQRIERSEDPLGLAIRCSLVGNFIDFGPTGNVSEEKLLQLVDDAPDMRLDSAALRELEHRIGLARTVAYLTDNCGEIVLDKLLIKQIAQVNPHARVTAIVRGAPVSNDATMDDAREVGLDSLVEVIGNGSNLAGTSPSLVNEQTRNMLRDADLVISKGLANYETLSGRGKNVRFLFLCKCALYQDLFEVPLHTGLIVRGVDTTQAISEARTRTATTKTPSSF